MSKTTPKRKRIILPQRCDICGGMLAKYAPDLAWECQSCHNQPVIIERPIYQYWPSLKRLEGVEVKYQKLTNLIIHEEQLPVFNKRKPRPPIQPSPDASNKLGQMRLHIERRLADKGAKCRNVYVHGGNPPDAAAHFSITFEMSVPVENFANKQDFEMDFCGLCAILYEGKLEHLNANLKHGLDPEGRPIGQVLDVKEVRS